MSPDEKMAAVRAKALDAATKGRRTLLDVTSHIERMEAELHLHETAIAKTKASLEVTRKARDQLRVAVAEALAIYNAMEPL